MSRSRGPTVGAEQPAEALATFDLPERHGVGLGFAVDQPIPYPPETRGKNSASQLKVAADFVVQVYEMELVKSGIAIKGEPVLDTPSDERALGAD